MASGIMGKTQYYCHVIDELSIIKDIEDSGERRWAAYRFTKMVYEKFMPRHIFLMRCARNFRVKNWNCVPDRKWFPSNSRC
jgi:hypothetical protein